MGSPGTQTPVSWVKVLGLLTCIVYLLFITKKTRKKRTTPTFFLGGWAGVLEFGEPTL